MLTEIALGNNNSAGLQTVVLQPDYDGIQYAVEIYAGNGDVYEDGQAFVELRFPDIVSPEDWVAVLAQFGLTSAKTALVTIELMDEDKVGRTVYNGRAVKKQYGQVNRWNMCWYEAPRIDVVKLEAV